MTQEELEQKQKEEERFKRGTELLEDINFLEVAITALLDLEDYKRIRAFMPPANRITIKAYMALDKQHPFWVKELDFNDDCEPIIDRLKSDLNNRLDFLKQRLAEL